MQLAHWAGLAAAAAILWAAWSYRQFYKKEHLVCPKCGHCIHGAETGAMRHFQGFFRAAKAYSPRESHPESGGSSCRL